MMILLTDCDVNYDFNFGDNEPMMIMMIMMSMTTKTMMRTAK